jgi:transposase
MAKQQKTYTREFKVEAVHLVKSSGKSMSQVARELGISESALYQWCKHLADQGEQTFPGSGHQTARGGRNCVASSVNWTSRGRSATS